MNACAYCYKKIGGKNFDHCKQCSNNDGKSYEYIIITKSQQKKLLADCVDHDFEIYNV